MPNLITKRPTNDTGCHGRKQLCLSLVHYPDLKDVSRKGVKGWFCLLMSKLKFQIEIFLRTPALDGKMGGGNDGVMHQIPFNPFFSAFAHILDMVES